MAIYGVLLLINLPKHENKILKCLIAMIQMLHSAKKTLTSFLWLLICQVLLPTGVNCSFKRHS